MLASGSYDEAAADVIRQLNLGRLLANHNRSMSAVVSSALLWAGMKDRVWNEEALAKFQEKVNEINIETGLLRELRLGRTYDIRAATDAHVRREHNSMLKERPYHGVAATRSWQKDIPGMSSFGHRAGGTTRSPIAAQHTSHSYFPTKTDPPTLTASRLNSRGCFKT